ncbi:MFS transporter [Novosphingobium terrae]|uniref:MFS transporter n=1 Tax=Novosphingobium terrae TaxID=2726189 RepID=UPI001980E9A3|nr:MFS transporter [Novosphingobium terrae]
MKNLIALMATCLAALMTGLEVSSVPVILPSIGHDLRADFDSAQWVMNAYTIACTSILMVAGTLADRLGRRRVFTASMILFGAASLGCGTARTMSMLIVYRVLQGAGGGAMLICLIAILSNAYRDGAERGRAFAIWGIVFGMGLGIGPLFGGLIASLIGWRWVFLIHGPLTILTIALVFATIRESRAAGAHQLDLAGMLSLSFSVLGLTFFIIEGPQYGFGSSVMLSMAAAALVSATIFVTVEWLSAHPMVDFSVFRIPNFTGAIMGSAGVNFSFWPLLIYLPLYFENGIGYDRATTGLILLAYTLPALLLPPLGEQLALRYSPRNVIPCGLMLIALGCWAITLGLALAAPGWISLLPGCILTGMGLGLANTPSSNAATYAVEADRAGMASGIETTIRYVALSLNIALMGLVLLIGVRSSLAHGGGGLDAAHASATAERLLTDGLGNDKITVAQQLDRHLALKRGFETLTVYAGLAALFFAMSSFIAFRCETSKRTVDQTQ